MEDLALAVSLIIGGVMIAGGVAGNKVAKHYGKSKVAGTVIGVAVGYIAFISYVRIKGNMDMKRMQEQQQQIQK